MAVFLNAKLDPPSVYHTYCGFKRGWCNPCYVLFESGTTNDYCFVTRISNRGRKWWPANRNIPTLSKSEIYDIRESSIHLIGNSRASARVGCQMNDVLIPETHVLIRGPDAFIEQLKTLNWEWPGGSTLANANARCALDNGLSYANREQFGQSIGNFLGIEWK